ncbi:uncharacterized protein LOC34621533 [Cyclospora cayetanensis]|uniref:Uncharacterized protein LOC34621533 n=1 Tax=Cyclospora cayetanensis TaxID=88456 RepID=A0A6P6S0F8_9EIME|nr:uncharacterized protein LOC34621533 [Cyclospora cayetanensis]
MELPDLSLGWLVFLVLFVGAAGAAGYLVLQEMRSSREKDIVLKQAGKEVDTSPPAREIEDYEEKRSALFQQLLVQQRVTEADEDLGEGQPPCKSWQRQLLQPEEKKALKLLLMRRALANTPRWFVLSGEANAKYRLYRNGLLTETAWSEFQAVQEELNEELQYIKLEAECMEEGWGDKVLKDTVMLFKLSEAQKERNKVMGAEQKRQEKEKERQERDKERQQEEKETRAEKFREQLLKEADQNKPVQRKVVVLYVWQAVGHRQRLRVRFEGHGWSSAAAPAAFDLRLCGRFQKGPHEMWSYTERGLSVFVVFVCYGRRHRARAAAAVAVAAGGKCPHTWGVGLKASHVPVQCTFGTVASAAAQFQRFEAGLLTAAVLLRERRHSTRACCGHRTSAYRPSNAHY